MAAKDELYGRTIRVTAVGLAIGVASAVAAAAAGPAARPFSLYGGALGLVFLTTLLWAWWRRREIDEVWRASERSREGFGYPYHLIPFGVGLGFVLFALLLALIMQLSLAMKIAWLCSGLTALIALGFTLPATVRLTRHVLPILWARVAGAPREGSPFAWEGTIVSGSLTRARSYRASSRQVTETRTDSSGRSRQVSVSRTIWDWHETITATPKLVLQVGEEELPIRLDQALGVSLHRLHNALGVQEWIEPGMRLVVAQARYLAPKGRGVEGQHARPLRLVAAKGPATRAAALAWLAEVGAMLGFAALVVLAWWLAATNPALTWYAAELKVMKASAAPVAVGDSCVARLGYAPSFFVGSVDRSPLPTSGWVGEGGAALSEPAPQGQVAQPAPLGGEVEVLRGRCYLRLRCAGELLVGGFDAGGFDCELGIDPATGALRAAFGGDADDHDGDPGWRFAAERFKLFADAQRLEGWLVLP